MCIKAKQTDLSILHTASEHDNGGDLIVPHHLPEPGHCQPCGTCPPVGERESRGGEKKEEKFAKLREVKELHLVMLCKLCSFLHIPVRNFET